MVQCGDFIGAFAQRGGALVAALTIVLLATPASAQAPGSEPRPGDTPAPSDAPTPKPPPEVPNPPPPDEPAPGDVPLPSMPAPGGEATSASSSNIEALERQRTAASPMGTFGADLGFGAIGEDYFLNINLRLSVDRDTWGIGVQAPLRLRVWDRDPKNDDDPGGILRKEDWDQVSDFFRIIRYVYLGQADKKGPYYIRLGELAGLTVGHGTIMHRYFNGIDANKWRTGINAVINTKAYSAEVMVGDLLDPYLVGARFSMRPIEAVAPGTTELGRRFIVGHSLFVDGKAPIALATDAMGNVITGGDGFPEVTRERALIVAGIFDLGYELVNTDILTLQPYMDLNKVSQVQNGWGWHVGLLTGLRVPLGFADLLANLRTEYRYVSGDYVGPYFNVVYEIERYQHLGQTEFDRLRDPDAEPDEASVQPKLAYLCQGDPLCNRQAPSARHGWFFEGQLALTEWLSVGFEYLDYSGPQADGQFLASLDIPALEFLQLSAYYYRVNVDGPGDLFAIDDKSAVVAQARIPIYWILALQVRWWRVWRSCGVEGTICEDGDTGYRSVDDWSIGAGLNYTF